MSFSGGCHCGAIAFTVDAEPPTKAMSFNCSICSKKAMLLSFFPADQFTVSGESSAITTYLFNAHKIEHRFCRVCGVQPFAYGKNADGSEMRAINLRTVVGLDVDALEIQHYDGASK
jgi:hypothetical protein